MKTLKLLIGVAALALATVTFQASAQIPTYASNWLPLPLVQPNMKKLVAYSSVSHLGFVVLGVFSFTQQGLDGAVYQMLNHGVSTGALFILVGYIYHRRHTRQISEYGGLWGLVPVFSALLLVVTLLQRRGGRVGLLR